MAKAKAGRPRSEQARELILGATHELLRENSGAGLNIEAIARRAGVGKPTIYRWWPSLADVVLEALLQQAGEQITVPEYDTFGETLRGFLSVSMQAIEHGAGIHLRFLMAQAQKDDEFRQRFESNFVTERRTVLRSIFLRAQENGQIPAGRNPDILVDMVFGAMWYRLLVGHAPMDDQFAAELTEVVMAALG
ncbi:TetR/AcrR family transcriptional regulator [Desulfovibrio sp. JC010]|uniref:TetR/AcrR family transcriptional regulator n=1 Tax=Desulfovibrio sp. JC010 TaxID=2593641 RepID=UPI0013D38854|nr:TetR/AcrR family transcriptional regulator [Desulfovibrio sp. JC010]NDV28729.1 TetR/AcrR family transcriptional regulator [Desulfovibrio sp. JC010]